ncbi:MAG: adenine phosphoribosyltransferase [Solirubrobacterales bacterium]|nr:adenine phosphoribosyltransferase [Solirubrobacterales bacterium]MBV9801161.1 adenine phosphoribosyltransferase [Solirubrobacterales bacterium]
MRALVRDVPDFPRPGIIFKDITPLLLDPAGLEEAVSGLAAFANPLGVDLVVAAEARGFILGGALARQLGAGFVPARKPGKLPSRTAEVSYELEYGIDALQIDADAVAGGARVLLHDDLLATGGTARAVCDLVAGLGGEIVACSFLIELSFLGGRARLAPHTVHALIDYTE